MDNLKVGEYYISRTIEPVIVKIIGIKKDITTNLTYVLYKHLDDNIFTIYRLHTGEFKRIYKFLPGYGTCLWDILNG